MLGKIESSKSATVGEVLVFTLYPSQPFLKEFKDYGA